ncbi:HlyB/MsbA family ABC transporter [Sphaerisporangium melleum]|uniref:HlyB/MsbA family ABC transporter n=1 Tax=Sphaerisporangium melleum TaxID=321316 RepID=A0A917VI60_9ACTN|nr:ABC transporter ATP-binding protein [Sphaerisporangium melleum]GGK80344.1 HlyB/MsbA family ABC transporter [Sphaerisporangium melleum]GII72057.1 HlyB/MsbA family ABC transporter [Sphaerisporangium melleum]
MTGRMDAQESARVTARAGRRSAARVRPWRVVARVTRIVGLRRYVIGALLWAPVSVLPLLSGLVLQRLFDHVSAQRVVAIGEPLWLCAALVGVEIVRGLVMVIAWVYGTYWWDAAATVLRANPLRSVLTARGAAAGRLPHSSGEAVARLRDDTADLVQLTDDIVSLVGAALFSAAALVIMAAIDPVVTLVLLVPMAAIGVLNRLLRGVVQRRHRRARVLGAMVTGFVGDVFGGVLAIKTAGAEDAVLRRLRERNRARRDAAVRDRLAAGLLETGTGAAVEISIGLVLLLAAPAMRRGAFTVGDLALFTGYAGWLAALPRTAGSMLSRLPQAAVAVERLTRLMASHEDATDLTRPGEVWFTRRPPSAAATPPGHDDPLEVLDARGLTVRHGHGRGVRDVDLRLARGSFTVVTGAVGAGKTTLVRALLGLAPLDAGTITWNGRPVADPGTFLVPGRAAYAGQVPRLFSESLRENLLLGHPGDGRRGGGGDAQIMRALELSVLDREVAAMADGLDTVVGPRGVRLSGGQVQRATAARALVRSPDLLVVDDLSSALDVETERLLWDRIAAAARDGSGPGTLLVVSHRRAVLERADQVVVLDRGRVAGRGTLTELLESCPEMRRLWTGELLVEAEEAR